LATAPTCLRDDGPASPSPDDSPDANTEKNDSYIVVNLRAGWNGELGGLLWKPFIEIGNVFDEEYNGSVVVNAFGGRFYEPSP
jgi:iron complex outermembrane receptor protein